jgi:hypothetical protein
MKTIGKMLTAVLLLGCAQTAQASPLFFRADLSGLNEVPPNASPGTGVANFMIDSFTNKMGVDVVFSGLTAPASGAHIHCCLATPFLTGVNVGVATTQPAFTGFPLGVTSGAFSAIFDMTLAGSYNPAFVAAQGGIPQAEAALFAGIAAGETYFNIHNTNFRGGEIRGFLVSVPEPITLSLFGAGLVGAAALRRRKVKA